jgi:pimeloyl-ACP methyl ester carboxylesterase
MPWRSLPHQLNNRKFDKAVVFVHGLNGNAKSWMGAPNKFVDRLSREREIYNHIGLFAFEYDPKMAEPGPLSKLFIAKKTKSNIDLKKIAMQLKTTLREMLLGYKTIVLVGHGMGGVIIKSVLVDIAEPPKCYYIDLDNTDDSVLEIDDPASHPAYNKVLALLHQLLEVEKQTGHH